MNRVTGVECVGDSTTKLGDKNPYWNCNIGPNCGNRILSHKKFPKSMPKRDKGKGWGLMVINGIEKDELVQEYVGEIIDEKMKRKRLEMWAENHPNDPNFYMMHLEPGWYIDAREKGSLSRFINHSCEPNCKLVPVNIAGHIRVSIIACKKVKPGEFLSYDYHFDTKHGDKFVCRCGSSKCRGTMKGGANLWDIHKDTESSKKKTKKELLIEANKKLDRDKKYLQEHILKENYRLYQVGMFVPGSSKSSSLAVASGPQLHHSHQLLQSNLCLWRNTLIGADFSSRYQRQVKKSIRVSQQKTFDMNKVTKK